MHLSSRRIAVVLFDVINDLEFEKGERLFETALPAAKNIAPKERARGVNIIYVNGQT
jgi:hypothetical protein